MTDDSGALAIDFIVGFTVFLLAFIWVISMIPGMLIGLQAYTIDYDAVAYRTGVILVEDPGAPADPGWPDIRPRENPWEFKTDKRDVSRFGLAISRDTPNILSENKVNRFFDRSMFNTTIDYRNKILFSTYPYRFNISLHDENQTHSVGDVVPKDTSYMSSYGYIQRLVKIKGASNATINESFFEDNDYINTDNVTTHIFTILINNAKLHQKVSDPLYEIDPEKEQIMVNITDLKSTRNNPNANITLFNIYVLNNVPLSTFPGVVIATNNKIRSLPAKDTENVSLILSPLFFKTIYETQGDVPLYLNLTFYLDAPSTFLNSSLTGPFEYNYDPKNVTQPQLRDGVLEVAIWSGETTSIVSYIIASSASGDGTISPSGDVSVAQGDSQTFTINPNVGSTINSVTVDGVAQTITNPTTMSYTFPNVITTHTITAKFTTGASKTITSSAGAGGQIFPPISGSGGPVSVAYGADQLFAIAPNGGYVIADVVVDGVSKGTKASYTFFNVQNDHTITASFKVPPVPTFTSINPTAGPIAGGTPVTITGTGFTGATAVTFDGMAATGLSVVSDTSITATTPAHAAGAVNVIVTTPGGTAPGPNAYTYTAAPTVTNIAPNNGPAAGGTSVTITGTGFTSAATVTFGVTAGTSVTFVSDTQITVTSPAKANGGTVDVRVTTLSGTSAISANDQFTYTGVAPTVTGIAPNSGPAAGGTSVTITGTGFTSAATVMFDTTYPGTSVTFVSDTQITATSPAHATGWNDVTVTTTSGTSPTSNADRFRFT